MDIITRTGQAAELADAGVTGAATEALLRLWAPRRHASRANAAWEAARAAATSVAEAALILALDAVGVGGTADAEGAATLRHPALQGLGKGRKHAADGGAWDAAIAAAAAEWVLTVVPADDGLSLTVTAEPADPHEREMAEVAPPATIKVGGPVAPARWVRAYALARLDAALSGSVVVRRRLGREMSPATIAAWSAVANHADAIRRLARQIREEIEDAHLAHADEAQEVVTARCGYLRAWRPEAQPPTELTAPAAYIAGYRLGREDCHAARDESPDLMEERIYAWYLGESRAAATLS